MMIISISICIGKFTLVEPETEFIRVSTRQFSYEIIGLCLLSTLQYSFIAILLLYSTHFAFSASYT